jgi:universal stress protein family protein
MSTQLTHPPPWTGAPGGAGARPPARVLVLCESSRNGVAALREAAELAGAGSELTVVSLAPQAVPARCCQRGPGVEVVNCVVREEAERELCEAREILGEAAERATFRTLVGTRDPTLPAWAAAQSFDLIVVPARRLSFGGHPFARRLRRATTAELRLVS